MLSNFSEVLEIIKRKCIAFLEQNRLLSQNQYGFRQRIGTCGALYCTTKYITKSPNNGKKSLAIFL